LSGYTKAIKPFLIGEGKNSVLLIHGFTGTPFELREFGQYLALQGFMVYAPLLPGHGTSKEDMINTKRADWIRGAESGLKLLQEKGSKHIFISGLSMGGTLTLYLGATHPEVQALAPICAPISLQDWRVKFLLPILKHFFKYSPYEEPVDILDTSVLENPVFKEGGMRYDQPALPSVVELTNLINETKEKLRDIKQPILIIQAKKDSVVSPRNAEYIFKNVASKNKKILWLENSAHVATLDFDKQTVFKKAADFFQSICSHKPQTTL